VCTIFKRIIFSDRTLVAIYAVNYPHLIHLILNFHGMKYVEANPRFHRYSYYYHNICECIFYHGDLLHLLILFKIFYLIFSWHVNGETDNMILELTMWINKKLNRKIINCCTWSYSFKTIIFLVIKKQRVTFYY
jgi:hypothetical protein